MAGPPTTTTPPPTIAAVGVLLVFVLVSVAAGAGARMDVTDVSAATEAKVVMTTVLFPAEFCGREDGGAGGGHALVDCGGAGALRQGFGLGCGLMGPFAISFQSASLSRFASFFGSASRSLRRC